MTPYSAQRITLNKLISAELLLIMAALVAFGLSFTKLNLFGPLHLYDFLIIFLGMQAAISTKKIEIHIPTFVIFSLALLYLLFSLIRLPTQAAITIRQFALFGYMVIAYLISHSFRHNPNQLSRLIVAIGIFSIFAQIAYIPFLIATGGFAIGDKLYKYLSPASIVGALIFICHALASVKTKMKRTVYIAIGLFCLAMSGHSSALLAGLVPIFLAALGRIGTRSRKILIFTGILLFPLFAAGFAYYYANIADPNALWRFIFWLEIMKKLLFENFMILGNGFGVPYASPELAMILEGDMGFSTHLADESEAMKSAPHNSFLTMAFHIGLLPALYYCYSIFKPAYRAILPATDTQRTRDMKFMGLGIFSIATWSSFNVVLELPHSSLFFWLLIFNLFAYRKLTRASTQA